MSTSHGFSPPHPSLPPVFFFLLAEFLRCSAAFGKSITCDHDRCRTSAKAIFARRGPQHEWARERAARIRNRCGGDVRGCCRDLEPHVFSWQRRGAGTPECFSFTCSYPQRPPPAPTNTNTHAHLTLPVLLFDLQRIVTGAAALLHDVMSQAERWWWTRVRLAGLFSLLSAGIPSGPSLVCLIHLN